MRRRIFERGAGRTSRRREDVHRALTAGTLSGGRCDGLNARPGDARRLAAPEDLDAPADAERCADAGEELAGVLLIRLLQ